MLKFRDIRDLIYSPITIILGDTITKDVWKYSDTAEALLDYEVIGIRSLINDDNDSSVLISLR